MKSKIIPLLLALSLLLSACGADPTPGLSPSTVQTSVPSQETTSETPVESEVPTVLGVELTDELTQRERDWIEDLETLRKEYDRYHCKPYSRKDFEEALALLAAKAGELSDNDIAYEIVALIAGMDDNHTSAVLPNSLDNKKFPLNVRYFGDKLYLTGYLEGYEQFEPYLLREIVAVNGVDMTYLRHKFESILSPSNSWYSKEHFPSAFFCPSFFDWAGCDYREGYTFQFLNENQEAVSVDVPVLSTEDFVALLDRGATVDAEALDSIHYLRGGNWAAYFDRGKDDYVYMSFTEQHTLDTAPYMEMFQETAAAIQAHPDCDKLVIDLRLHPGGYSDLLDDFREFVQLLKAPSIEYTYVLTGGFTTSAATYDICLFKNELNAVTVGEPTGQFTSLYGYTAATLGHPRFVLPHSQINVFVSDHPTHVNDWAVENGYAKLTEEAYDENGRLYEWENTILPDVFVYQDIEDICQGKDSVIEWVLAQ